MNKNIRDAEVENQFEAWQCDACGTEVSFEDTTCSSCGADISKVNEDASISSKPEPEALYKGVAGWLKFLCAVLMLNPLFTLIALVNEFDSIKQISWFYWTDRNLRIPVILGIIFSIGLAAFSAYAGYALLTRTDRKAIIIAKTFFIMVLVSRLVVTVMVFALLNSWRRVSPAHVDAITYPYLWMCIGTFVVVLAWLMYLNGSIRVKATYVD
jgi:hypothetical protein